MARILNSISRRIVAALFGLVVTTSALPVVAATSTTFYQQTGEGVSAFFNSQEPDNCTTTFVSLGASKSVIKDGASWVYVDVFASRYNACTGEQLYFNGSADPSIQLSINGPHATLKGDLVAYKCTNQGYFCEPGIAAIDLQWTAAGEKPTSTRSNYQEHTSAGTTIISRTTYYGTYATASGSIVLDGVTMLNEGVAAFEAFITTSSTRESTIIQAK